MSAGTLTVPVWHCSLSAPHWLCREWTMAFGRERKIITTIMWEELGMRRARLRQHIVELLKLAAPVIVARAGLMVMSAVDILIVARYSSEELASLGLGTPPASMLVTSGIGMLLGTMILTSHAVGAGRFEECGPIWRRSLPYALLLGVLATLASLLGQPFFRLTGQERTVAEGGARVLAVLG